MVIPNLACVVGVAFNWEGTIFEADRNNFYVNGTMVSLPYSFGGIIISPQGPLPAFITTLPNGVQINYWPSSLHISVPPTLQESITGGVCGNYDNIFGNEWFRRNGGLYTEPYGQFVNAWVVGNDPSSQIPHCSIPIVSRDKFTKNHVVVVATTLTLFLHVNLSKII